MIRPTPRQNRQQAVRRGRWAESLCRWWLRLNGYRILAHDLVVGRGTGAGQVDIIARRGQVIAFIEVKARVDHDSAAQAITPAQQRRLIRAAQQRRLIRAAQVFLTRHPELSHCDLRFDAMLMTPWHFPVHVTDAWREGLELATLRR